MKKLTTCIVICLLLFSVSAMADSISPTSVTATLGVGDSITVEKTVTVSAGTPTSSKVDVFFLADETGSMGSYIGAVETAASSILTTTASLGDVAFGVGGYRDIYDSFVYHQNTDLTTNLTTAQTAIDDWSASGGGDGPEAQFYALETLANDVSWRAGSERIVVWFGDYPGHDPRNGSSEASATAALVANDISVQALNVGAGYLDTYYPGDPGSDDATTGQATRITAATFGTLYSGINTSNIVTAITDAINYAVATYTTVGIDTSEVPGGVSVAVLPPSFLGTYDRSIERSFTFDVTFTGDVLGDYIFNLYGTVDGGRVATELDEISVVPVPGAFLLGMLGLSVAGIKLRKRT